MLLLDSWFMEISLPVLGPVTVLLGFIIYFCQKNLAKQKCDHRAPVAPLGILESIRGLTGPRAPFIMLDMVKAVKSDIYSFSIGITVVGDPLVIREILQDKVTEKPEAIYASFDFLTVGTKGVFTLPNNNKLKMLRKVLAPAFSSKEIKRMDSICSKHTEMWIEKTLKPCIERGECFDPSKEMCHLTFRIIAEAGFEYAGLQDDDIEDFSHHLEAALREFSLKQVVNPLRKYYGPFRSDYRSALDSCKKLCAFAKNILDKYRSNPNKSSNNTLIKIIAENEAFESDDERAANIVTFFVAGRDTTGFSLGTILTLLAKHHRVYNKLHQELSSAKISERSKCKYLKHVINESNRVLPVAAGGEVRAIGRDVSCKNGSIIIPKGTLCFMPQIIPNRNPVIFKDPDQFSPERWETEDKSMREALLPFALGVRNCIGQYLALSEIYSVLSRLVADYKFDIENEGYLEHFLTLKHVNVSLRPSKA